MLELTSGNGLRSAVEPSPARVRHEGRPTLSVVSLAEDDSAATLRLMAERAGLWERFGVELITVCASRRTTPSTVSAVSGAARLIYGPADATESQLRAMGFAASTGDIVILVDDLTTADDSWIEHVSVTGAVRRFTQAHDGDRQPGTS